MQYPLYFYLINNHKPHYITFISYSIMNFSYFNSVNKANQNLAGIYRGNTNEDDVYGCPYLNHPYINPMCAGRHNNMCIQYTSSTSTVYNSTSTAYNPFGGFGNS